MGTWYDCVEQVLKELGGSRHLSEIYRGVKNLREEKGLPLGQYEAWVRYELNHNCDGKGKDTFVRVRRGFYRLREDMI